MLRALTALTVGGDGGGALLAAVEAVGALDLVRRCMLTLSNSR